MERFLVKLIGASEGLDPDDEFKPQLLTVEYDDVAMAEVIAEMAEMAWVEHDDKAEAEAMAELEWEEDEEY
jgi:hypothetical protein